MIVLPHKLQKPNKFLSGLDLSAYDYRASTAVVTCDKPFFQDLAYFQSAVDTGYGLDWDEHGNDRRCGLNAAQIIDFREDFQQQITPRQKHPFYIEPSIISLMAHNAGISEEAANHILDGEIAPYIGGRLRLRPKRGINPKAWPTTTERFIARALVRAAFELLDEAQFNILCAFNSMTLDEGLKIATDTRGSYDDRKRQIEFQCSLFEETTTRRRVVGVAGTTGIRGRP